VQHSHRFAEVGSQTCNAPVASLYHQQQALGYRDTDDDDEFTSVLSSSLWSSPSVVSAPSSQSTDVLSYLEKLKGYGGWTEEVKSFQRAVIRKELRRRAQSTQAVADELSAKFREAKALKGLRNSGGCHTTGSALTASGADSMCSSCIHGSAEEGSMCGSRIGKDANESRKDLWERRLMILLEGSAREQDSFQLGLYQTPDPSAASRNRDVARRQEQRWELLRAKTDASPKHHTVLLGSDASISAQDMWLQRLRLYYDNAEATMSSCLGSRASSSVLVEDEDGEACSETPAGLQSSSDMARVAPLSSLEEAAAAEADLGRTVELDILAAKSCSRTNVCLAAMSLGVTLLVVLVLAVWPESQWTWAF